MYPFIAGAIECEPLIKIVDDKSASLKGTAC